MLRKFRNLFFCMMLALNALQGVPMRPDEIEDLMAAMKQPKVAHVLRQENDNGDD